MPPHHEAYQTTCDPQVARRVVLFGQTSSDSSWDSLDLTSSTFRRWSQRRFRSNFTCLSLLVLLLVRASRPSYDRVGKVK